MASGLPVDAARSGGPIDTVQHGYNGYLFDPESLPDFILNTRKLLSDGDSLARMRVHARLSAESRTWKSVMDGLFEEYRRLAGRPVWGLGETSEHYGSHVSSAC